MRSVAVLAGTSMVAAGLVAAVGPPAAAFSTCVLATDGTNADYSAGDSCEGSASGSRTSYDASVKSIHVVLIGGGGGGTSSYTGGNGAKVDLWLNTTSANDYTGTSVKILNWGISGPSTSGGYPVFLALPSSGVNAANASSLSNAIAIAGGGGGSKFGVTAIGNGGNGAEGGAAAGGAGDGLSSTGTSSSGGSGATWVYGPAGGAGQGTGTGAGGSWVSSSTVNGVSVASYQFIELSGSSGNGIGGQSDGASGGVGYVSFEFFAGSTSQSVSLADGSGTVGTAVTLSATQSAGSGSFSYALASGGTATGCSISGSSLTVTGAGTCKVNATAAGDSTYLPATTTAAATYTFAAASSGGSGGTGGGATTTETTTTTTEPTLEEENLDAVLEAGVQMLTEDGTPVASDPGTGDYLNADGTTTDATYLADGESVTVGNESDLQVQLGAGNDVPVADDGDGVDGGGIITFVRGREGVVQGSGFAPNSTTEVWINSEPRSLISAQVDASGRFEVTLEIPDAVPDGDHTISAEGLTTQGQARAITAGVRLTTEEIVAAEQIAAQRLVSAKRNFYYPKGATELRPAAKKRVVTWLNTKDMEAGVCSVAAVRSPKGMSSEVWAKAKTRARKAAALLERAGCGDVVVAKPVKAKAAGSQRKAVSIRLFPGA